MKAESPGNAPFSDFRRNGHETEQDAQQIPVYAFPKKGRGERHKKPGGQSQKGGQQHIGVFFYHKSLRRNKMSFYYNGNGTGGEWRMGMGDWGLKVLKFDGAIAPGFLSLTAAMPLRVVESAIWTSPYRA